MSEEMPVKEVGDSGDEPRVNGEPTPETAPGVADDPSGTDANDEATVTSQPSDSCQTLQELATSLAVDLLMVGKCLKTMGMIQKQGYWVLYELKLRDIERHFLTCELLLERQKRKGFLHRIVTGDEKWIHYDYPKRRKSWVKLGQPSTSVAKQNIHESKLLLCICKRHDKVILLHDNAHPHVAKPVKTYLGTLKWDVLPHPPYSPDIAPSDYHLF
ncbi:Mariner Mos1 transposase [Eumeta japonica]|uniref:Mariner Mos1 transposase n=1 Tax=Eumeta variegata TaxID=151549 RepID=A0A4C1WUD1_EUMVA|nr:Mariner Mos1 transposase [Eumeta japonica]